MEFKKYLFLLFAATLRRNGDELKLAEWGWHLTGSSSSHVDLRELAVWHGHCVYFCTYHLWWYETALYPLLILLICAILTASARLPPLTMWMTCSIRSLFAHYQLPFPCYFVEDFGFKKTTFLPPNIYKKYSFLSFWFLFKIEIFTDLLASTPNSKQMYNGHRCVLETEKEEDGRSLFLVTR